MTRAELDAGGLALQRRPPANIQAERLKYRAEVPVVRLSTDREIEDFLDASSPAT